MLKLIYCDDSKETSNMQIKTMSIELWQMIFDELEFIDQLKMQQINSKLKELHIKKLPGKYGRCISNETLLRLSYLQQAYLGYNEQITDAGLVHLGRVHTINLSNTNITDNGLSHLKTVSCINLFWTSVTDAGLIHLKNAHTIQLSWTGITDVGLQYLKNARFIDLSSTQITDLGLVHLKNVQCIDLDDTSITKIGFKTLKSINQNIKIFVEPNKRTHMPTSMHLCNRCRVIMFEECRCH